MKGTRDTHIARVLPPIALFLLILVVWQLATSLRNIPRYLLPGPADVFAALLANVAKLAQATGVTAAGAICGFLLSVFVGTFVAVIFSQSALIRRSCFPYAIFANSPHRGGCPVDCALVRNGIP